MTGCPQIFPIYWKRKEENREWWAYPLRPAKLSVLHEQPRDLADDGVVPILQLLCLRLGLAGSVDGVYGVLILFPQSGLCGSGLLLGLDRLAIDEVRDEELVVRSEPGGRRRRRRRRHRTTLAAI